MKTKYQYINFVLLEKKEKTSIYQIRNNNHGHQLGIIKWHSPWRQYCFWPYSGTVFNKGCLDNINHFIDQLMDERKNQKLTKIK
jgi:hypothetical protein